MHTVGRKLGAIDIFLSFEDWSQKYLREIEVCVDDKALSGFDEKAEKVMVEKDIDLWSSPSYDDFCKYCGAPIEEGEKYFATCLLDDNMTVIVVLDTYHQFCE